MLTRRAAAVAVAALVVGAGLATARAQAADPVGGCPPNQPDCQVVGTLPSQPPTPGGGNNGGGGSGGGTGQCQYQGKPAPCSVDGLGWLSSDGCYYKQDQPPNPDPHNGQGAYYTITCGVLGGGAISVQQAIWRATPPAGFGVTPAQLAQQALAKIRLLGADVGLAPAPGGSGLVGLPVWMWTAVTANTWGPITASASAGGLTVDITGHATKIVWDMGVGDGHDTITCTAPGTPYQASYGAQPSPDCGYATGYQHSSRALPGGVYHVTATTTWQVDWAGGGVTGVIMTTRQSQTTVHIDELQVVTS